MAGGLLPQPKQLVQDNAWNPGIAYQLYTYEPASLTPKVTYQDNALTIANTNPVVANARGEVVMYGSGSYRIILKDSLGNTIWDRDNIDALVGGSSLLGATGAALVGYDDTTLDVIFKSRLNRVVSSISALRALNKSKNTQAFVTGYYAAGDGGGGAYYYDAADTTTADNAGTVIVAADGGRWKLAYTTTLSVKQFGAKGNGTTDDRPSIQAAIDASLPGGTLYIPTTNASFYSMSKASGSYCLSVTKPVNIVGDGLYSALNPDATATALVDTINLTPSAAYGFYGMSWDNFAIGNPNTGNRNGRHGIFIDTQAVGSQLSKPVFRRLFIGQGNGTLPNAIYHVNNGTNNVNGGMYCAEIVDCPALKGGVSLNASGDSNIIQRNNINGNGIGVYASVVSGASLLTIMDNNITTNGGQIRIDAGSRTKILHNNIEQQGATTGSTIMIYLSGLNGTMTMCEVRGNHLGAFTGANMTANVQIGANVFGTIVEDNTMLNANIGFTGPCINNAGVSTRVGFNNYGTNIITGVTDTGSGTMGVKKPLTLANGWVTLSGYPAPYYFKDITGTVTIHGEVSTGTATPGTVIATLPADAYPSGSQEFACAYNSSGTYAVGVFAVNAANGNISIQAGGNAQFGLHASYRAANAGYLSADS